MLNNLKVAIADDEPLARERIIRMLKECGCEVIGEFQDGEDLLSWLRSGNEVDVIYIDIQMPGILGIDIIKYLPTGFPVVLVTAHPEHAVDAFDVDAVDYLVKPIFKDRVERSVCRVRELLKAKNTDSRSSVTNVSKFPIKTSGGYVFVEIGKVLYFEVDKTAVWAWVGGKRCRTKWVTLSEVESTFPNLGFLRIQRQILLRPEKILGLRSLPGGRCKVLVGEGVELEVSRNMTPTVRAFLGLS